MPKSKYQLHVIDIIIAINENGIWGFLMNVIFRCSFACTAAFVYKIKGDLNTTITMIIYKSVVTALRHAHICAFNGLGCDN